MTYFSVPLPGVTFRFTDALAVDDRRDWSTWCWRRWRRARNLSIDAADAAGVSRVRQREHRASDLHASARRPCWSCCIVFRVVVREAGGRLDDLEPDAAVPRPVDARSELLRDRRQAGQRADRGAGVPAGVLHLAGDVPGGGERRPHGRRACRRSRSSTTKKCWCGRTWSTPR